MKKKAKRSKTIMIDQEIEIISQRLVVENVNPDSLWIKLDKKCVITGKRFKVDDSISIIMYKEEGMQLSGGCLTSAL